MALSAAATAALISGGAALLGTGINAGATAIRNRKQLGYQKELAAYTNEMNLENWKLQNAYNSPQAQMERYKEAGLNPNLVYGQGTPGNAGALPGYDTPRVDLETPRIDLASVANNALTAYYDSQVKEAQVKSMDASAMRTRVGSLLDTSRLVAQNLSNSLARQTLDYSVEASRLAIDREAQRLYNDSVTGTLLWKQVQEAASRITLNDIRANRERSEKERLDLDNRLRRVGLNPNDSLWARLAYKLCEKFFTGKETPINPVMDAVKESALQSFEQLPAGDQYYPRKGMSFGNFSDLWNRTKSAFNGFFHPYQSY